MKKYLTLLMMFLLIGTVLNAQDSEKSDKKDFGRNNISLMLSDVVMKRLSFEYEHVFGDKGNMSINIPFSYAIGESEDVYSEYLNWWVGLGMKLYPTGQGTIRYYVGPEVRVISSHENINNIYYYDGYVQEDPEITEDYMHTAFLLNNGMIYEPTEHFIFTVNLGLGFLSKDSKTGDGVQPMATPSVRMGFRF